MRLTRLIKWLAIGWTIAIFVGCALPGNNMPHLDQSDKLMHFGIFGFWGFLWSSLYRQSLRVLLFGILYGFLIECYQGIMPIGRSFEWLDLVADAVGVLAGILASMYLGRRWVKRYSQTR